MELPEILTVDLAAELLLCEPLTVQAKAAAGELPGLKLGRSWVFPREALMSTLNAQALAQAAARAKPATPKAVLTKPAAPPNRRTKPVSFF